MVEHGQGEPGGSDSVLGNLFVEIYEAATSVSRSYIRDHSSHVYSFPAVE